MISHDLMSEAGQQAMERARLGEYEPRPRLGFEIDPDERIPFPVVAFDEPTPEELAAMAQEQAKRLAELERWAQYLKRTYPGMVNLDNDAPALLRTQAI